MITTNPYKWFLPRFLNNWTMLVSSWSSFSSPYSYCCYCQHDMHYKFLVVLSKYFPIDYPTRFVSKVLTIQNNANIEGTIPTFLGKF